MASNRIDRPLRGFVLHSALFGSDTLSTADSSYTQAGPMAGGIGAPASATGSNAAPRGEVEGLGDQDVPIVVEALAGGNPGFNGMTGGWRLASESSTQVRGWTPPNTISGFWSPDASTAASDSHDAVAMRNGKILACVRTDSTGALRMYSFDPTTTSFTTETAPIATVVRGVALAVDADGFIFVLAQDPTLSVWYLYRSQSPDTSSDGWDTVAQVTFSTSPGATPGKMRLVLTPIGDWALFEITDSGANLTVTQWASDDGGANFTLVSTDTTTFEGVGDVVLTPGGRIGMALRNAATIVWYSTTSAWQSLISTTAVTIAAAAAVGEAWIAADPNGKLWAWWQYTTTDRIFVSSSTDDGATWASEVYQLTDNNADTGHILTLGRAVFAMGEAYLYCAAFDTAAYDEILIRLGGWENVQWRYGSGGFAAITNTGTWIPICEPSALTIWTPDASNNDARTTFNTDGRMEIATSANTQWYSATTIPVAGAASTAHCETQFNAEVGGSASAFRIGFSLRVSDAATASEIQVWAYTTGFVVRSHTATLATITVDMTADMCFKAFITFGGHVAVYYRRPYSSVWLLAYESSTVSTAGVGTVGWIRWGHNASSTSTSNWSYFWYAALQAGGNILAPSSRLVTLTTIPLRGKPLTGLAAPLGVGSQGTSNQRLLHVRAKDGPAYLGDTWTITPRYAHPISAIFPTESPSPRHAWRSTSTAENVIAFELDPTYATSITRHMGLALYNVNFPLAYLETYDGGWNTTATWDGRIATGLTYVRTGNTIRANSGSRIARYIWRNELVGAIVDLGSSKYRRIVRHTEGIWGGGVSGKTVELVLEGIDGTEPASGSSLAIWSQRGVVVFSMGDILRRWRLRIPSQANADGYHQIGAMCLGPTVAFGQQYSWGWTDVKEPNASRSVTADRVSRVRRRGPAVRTWTWAWTTLVSQRRLRNATPVPDYLGPDGVGQGMANQQDVPWLLAGYLDECRSGEIPMTAMKMISTVDGTMQTDQTLFMLGRLNSSIGFENELGDETAGEAGRVSPIAIEELA